MSANTINIYRQCWSENSQFIFKWEIKVVILCKVKGHDKMIHESCAALHAGRIQFTVLKNVYITI